MTLREKIARKLHALAWDGLPRDKYEDEAPSWLSDADAILREMYDPTPGIVFSVETDSLTAITVWCEMILAALAEKDG